MSIFRTQGYFKSKKNGVNGDRFLDIDTPKHANNKKYPKTCSAYKSLTWKVLKHRTNYHIEKYSSNESKRRKRKVKYKKHRTQQESLPARYNIESTTTGNKLLMLNDGRGLSIDEGNRLYYF